MSFPTALQELMTSTMKVRSLSGFSTNGYFVPTYASSTKTWACRLLKTQELVRTAAGTEEIATSVAWVKSTSTFSPSDKITVNGSTLGALLRIDHFSDEDGHHHSKVWWAEWR